VLKVRTVLLVLKELTERRELKVHKVLSVLKVLKVQMRYGTSLVLTAVEILTQLVMLQLTTDRLGTALTLMAETLEILQQKEFSGH
jgi:hypothetical protein